MRQKTKVKMIIALIPVFLLGLLAVSYPLIASWMAERNHSGVITDYQQSVEVKDDRELEEVRAAARAYNDRLFAGEFSHLEYEENGYFDLLDLNGSGIMCRIEIPKIGVDLPVYHSVEESALAKGAGHMPQSSLPVGGVNSHAVISAHTGMASSPLFTDLELLEEGDIFYITVLGERMAYEVDQIRTVLPYQVDDIQLARGEDLVTLVTCTPYGINTHRLLVRGHRVDIPDPDIDPDPEAEKILPSESDSPQSRWAALYLQGILNGLGLAVILTLFFIIILTIRNRRKE